MTLNRIFVSVLIICVQVLYAGHSAAGVDTQTCLVFERELDSLVKQRQKFNVKDLEDCLANNKITDADHYLGLIYLIGINVIPDYEKGLKSLMKSANTGNMNSLAALGDFYVISHDHETFKQGIELLKIAMRKQNIGAVVSLSSLIHHKKLKPSAEVEQRIVELFSAGNAEIVLSEVNFAVETAIRTSSASPIEQILLKLKGVDLSTVTKGNVHYLVARAFITEGTGFYNIHRAQQELDEAALNGHKDAVRLIDGLKKLSK